MNRWLLFEACLCLCVVLSTVGCGKRVTAAAAMAGDTGPHPPKVIPDMDANNFKVEHPEQFPLAAASEYDASPELSVTGTIGQIMGFETPLVDRGAGLLQEIHAS